MGKNKAHKSGRGKKDSVVFKVAGVRKPKIKSVNTNLKKLNVKNKTKTEESDKVFTAVQESVIENTKPIQKKPKKAATEHKEIPNMEEAAVQFSKL